MNAMKESSWDKVKSRRLDGIRSSPMLALQAKTAELRASCHDMIGLATGEPDFETPLHIQIAAFDAMRRGETRYTAVEGTRSLREAVASKFKRENGLDFSLNEIIVTSGAKQAIYNAISATIDARDEVIIPTPCYPSYLEAVKICDGAAVEVTCGQDVGFKLQPADLERAITERTKWLILCSPSNPTGATYTREELKALGEVLERHPQVWVLSDDIYEHLLFTEAPHATMAAVMPALRERTLTVNGVSKAYCMTGWRIGYAAGPSALIGAISTLQSQQTSNPSSISQAAALAALNGQQDFMQPQLAAYRKRRDLVVKKLNEIQVVDCPVPDGAFYTFASCEKALGRQTPDGAVINSDVDFASYILREAKVAVVPGSVFGLAPFFRISYAADTALLSQACERIAKACESLTNVNA